MHHANAQGRLPFLWLHDRSQHPPRAVDEKLPESCASSGGVSPSCGPARVASVGRDAASTMGLLSLRQLGCSLSCLLGPLAPPALGRLVYCRGSSTLAALGFNHSVPQRTPGAGCTTPPSAARTFLRRTGGRAVL